VVEVSAELDRPPAAERPVPRGVLAVAGFASAGEHVGALLHVIAARVAAVHGEPARESLGELTADDLLARSPLQALEDDDDAFFAVNALLLRNPSVVNLLDGCAISLPCHDEGEWPVGLMLWAPALADERLLGVARAVEAALTARR
jgi:Asp-tRNA(Asn)/Glu-tRNA(Gln) amidotransferase A subunit family amidase